MEYNINKRKFDNFNIDYLSNKKCKYVLQHPLIYSVENEIHFSANIEKITIEIIIKELSEIINKFYKTNDESEPLNITYVVDTPGGSVCAVLKFVDYIKLIKSKYPNILFTSIISGFVASAGTIMCIVADSRLMTQHAYAMIHELSSGYDGNFTQLMSYNTHLTELHNCLLDIYMSKTEKSKEDLEELLKNETWYNAKDYLSNNFIDAIK